MDKQAEALLYADANIRYMPSARIRNIEAVESTQGIGPGRNKEREIGDKLWGMQMQMEDGTISPMRVMECG